MLTPRDRVILITGANRGIGLATAKLMAAQGYTLSLGTRNPGDFPAAEFEEAPFAHAWEATDAASSQEWVAATIDLFGRIDGVVLNAGVEIGGSLETGTEDEFDTMFAVNFKGPLWLARACLPHLKASGASGRSSSRKGKYRVIFSRSSSLLLAPAYSPLLHW